MLSQHATLNNLKIQMGELLNAFNNSSQDNLPSDPNDNLGSDSIDQFNVIIPRAKKL